MEQSPWNCIHARVSRSYPAGVSQHSWSDPKNVLGTARFDIKAEKAAWNPTETQIASGLFFSIPLMNPAQKASPAPEAFTILSTDFPG